MPGILEFFSLQNVTKKKKIGVFSIFSCFTRSAGKASKNVTIPNVVAILKPNFFLNI
jgi:hypothetical protein